MPKFRIDYLNPDTNEWEVEYCEFFSTPVEVTKAGLTIGPISAKEWAEDLAYSLSDKGPYKVQEDDNA